MPTPQQRPITLKADHNSQHGTLDLVQYSLADRVTRALLALAVCWALAGITVFIPLAHFILVPGFFLAGVVLTFKRMQQNEAKGSATGMCPHCGKSISIKMESNDKLPKWVYCPLCDKPIELSESTI